MSTPDGLIEGGIATSQSELFDNARRAATVLASFGVGEGDRVAWLLPNCAAVFEATFGSAMLGASTVPINRHSTADEIGYILQDSAASALIAVDNLATEVLRGRAGACRVVTHSQWRDALRAATPAFHQPRGAASPMFYTSGTTGRPKGVLRGHSDGHAATARDLHCFGLDGLNIRSVMTGPLHHSAPNAYAMLVVETGGLLVLQPRFDPAELLQLIEQYRITNLHMVPTMFVRLLALDARIRQRYDLSSLRHVVHGAAPCPPEIKRAMIRWWGPIIHEYYAMTETGFIACSTSEEWLAHPASVGRAAPGVRIEIRAEDGLRCGWGETGEICVCTESSATVRYHGDQAKSAALHDGAFLRTGDTGFLDSSGFLTISGRKSDLVISGGVNIYPAEIEHAVLTIQGVRDCAVFGIPDAEYGEALVAAIEADPVARVKADHVITYLRERIAGYKIPRIIRILPSLPREDSGKIRKHKLRDDLFPPTAG